MALDLDIPVEIIGVPTVRDSNGLALSSRNAYLTREEYDIAIHLNKILRAAGEDVRAGKGIEETEKKATRALLDIGFQKVDYVAVRDAQTLETPDRKDRYLRVLAAAWLGKARLIDNLPIDL